MLSVVCCSCGVMVLRWVTVEDAARELVLSELLTTRT